MEKQYGAIVMVEEAPPLMKGPRGSLPDKLEEEGALATLRKNKGKWFRVLDYGSDGGANQAKTRLSKTVPDIEWIRRGKSVYGRYGGKK